MNVHIINTREATYRQYGLKLELYSVQSQGTFKKTKNISLTDLCMLKTLETKREFGKNLS